MLIKKARESRFLISDPALIKGPAVYPSPGIQCLQNLTRFIENKRTKRLYLGARFNNAYLTMQELKIIESLMVGRTVPYTIKTLAVSNQTMKTYLSTIKRKFGCKTLIELGFLLTQL